MATTYFEIDNTPTVGRVNTFLCHASATKGFIHFFNVDVLPYPVRIREIKNYNAEFFVVKLFVKSCQIGRNYAFPRYGPHPRFTVDKRSLEVIPIQIEKSLPLKTIASYVKNTGYIADGGAGAVKSLHKVISACLAKNIDISDCCREITKNEYDAYLTEKERKEKEEWEAVLRAVEESKRKRRESQGEITAKYYSQEDGLFHVIYEFKRTFEKEDVTFTSFDDFYKECHSNLHGADLLDFGFDGIDLSKYELVNAKISSKTMTMLGMPPDEVHKRIKKGEDLCRFVPSESKDLVPSRMRYGITETYPDYEENDDVFLYISDLHINHKLSKKFPNGANRHETNRYFEEIAKSLKRTMPRTWRHTVFIAGDVSFDFAFFKDFFKAYRKHISAKTYFIIGNHELWDRGLCRRCKTFEAMAEEYKKILKPLNIDVLESELMIPSIGQNTGFKHKYTCKEVLEMPDEKIREAFRYASYAILGGMGFAGLNEAFNCNHLIYKFAPITREYEIQRSKLLSDTHEKLSRIVPDKKLIVVTHMSFADWCSGDPVPNWIYVSGHTHKNVYIESDEVTAYADNQIGYDNDSFGFKFFALKPYFNIFDDYPDGIHEINREDYEAFYYGLGNRAAFNRQFAKLYMLKREKTYLFLIRLKEDGPLYILNGGTAKRTFGRGPEYFYERMANYAKSVTLFLSKYSALQKAVSKEIREFGGSGTIHGCIVDIDFYDHLYLNPLDGKITPYHAESITSKNVYTNVASLLKYCAPALYDNYIKLIRAKGGENALMIIGTGIELDRRTVFVPETDMYRVSRIIKGLQYTTQFNVIRLWNYSIADDASEEAGRLIVSGIINPDSTPKTEDLSKPPKAKKPKVVKEAIPKATVPKETYYEKHQKRVEAESGGTIELVSLPNCRTDATLSCKTCKHTWRQRIDHFYRFPRCPKCKKGKE